MRSFFVFVLGVVCVAAVPFISVRSQGADFNIRYLSEEKAGCDLSVSPDARVVAFGAYEGGWPSLYSLEPDTGHETRKIIVDRVPEHNRVFLVLSAYDPVIWVFTPEAAAQADGVLVMGYHRQAVANLPVGTQARIITYVDAEDSNCGKAAYAYQGGHKLDQLDRRVFELTGRNIDSFSGAYGPKSFPSKAATIAPALLNLVVWGRAPKKMVVPAGPAGVKVLVNTGVLRPATNEDIDAWLAAATKRSPTGHLAPVPRSEIHKHELYVALKSFQVPPGLHGAHSISVILNDDIQIDDRGSHNTYYSVSTGERCRPGYRKCRSVKRCR